MDRIRKRHSSLPLFLGFLLVLTLSACGGNKAKTTAEAPDTTNTTGTTTDTTTTGTAPGTTTDTSPDTIAPGKTGGTSDDRVGDTTGQETNTEAAQGDAQSDIRRNQLNADIRAREERNNAATGGSAQNRDEGDLASEVRSKLEANIPRGDLTVTANNDDITVSGVVTSQAELNKIEPLAKEIKGVRTVTVKAVVNPAG